MTSDVGLNWESKFRTADELQTSIWITNIVTFE